MGNLHKSRTGPAREIYATVYTMAGPSAAYRSESTFRQECWLALLMLPLASTVGRSWVETPMLIGSLLLLVMVFELLNSDIEAAIDRVSFEWRDLPKHAKDLASAAVFLSVLLCAGIWLAAMWQRLA